MKTSCMPVDCAAALIVVNRCVKSCDASAPPNDETGGELDASARASESPTSQRLANSDVLGTHGSVSCRAIEASNSSLAESVSGSGLNTTILKSGSISRISAWTFMPMSHRLQHRAIDDVGDEANAILLEVHHCDMPSG